ncbi:MAG: GTP-binding protein [Pseudomonadota bacterium]
MNADIEPVEAVPTNIVTGFLGVGKTSTIKHLLATRPAGERWAVLVNEFGEIGIDGSLFAGEHTEAQGVFLREVPGGCMCCAAGLPMQVALNELLSRARPDRLLIEPTGLGHPREVLDVLSSGFYRDAIELGTVLALVDARKLTDSRYTGHDTFNQQIEIADVIVGNKRDLYGDGDAARLTAYAAQRGCAPERIVLAENGAIDPALLRGATRAAAGAGHHHHEPDATRPLAGDQPLPPCGYLKADNAGEGFESVGWRFSPSFVFDRQRLLTVLTGVVAERLKAVFITESGVFGYNLTPDALTEIELDDCMESRIEIIAERTDGAWDEQLMACISARQ